MRTVWAAQPVNLVASGWDWAGSIFDRDALARYVLSRRTPEGGYSYYRTPQWGIEEPNAPDTLAALESFRMLRMDAPEATTTGNWLRGLQDDFGGYPSLIIGWAALRSIAVLGIEPRCSPIAWLGQFDLLTIGREGTCDWSGALRDVLHFVQLARLTGFELHGIENAAITGILKAARDPDGGWALPGPELETTAVAIRIAAHIGLDCLCDVAASDFVGRCEDKTLGLRLTPAGRATSVDALWGGLDILRSLGHRPTYPGAIVKSLALLQRPNGGLGARHRSIATLQATWRGLEASDTLIQLKEKRP